jgi:GxxExxY protein
VDANEIEQMTDQEIGQMLNYFKVTGLPDGLILNFKNSKIKFRRAVATTQNFIWRNNS